MDGFQNVCPGMGNAFLVLGQMKTLYYWRCCAAIQHVLCNLWQQAKAEDLKLNSWCPQFHLVNQ